MPGKAAGNSVLRSSPSSSVPSTSFVFIRTSVPYGETTSGASHCDGFPTASSTTSTTVNCVSWPSPITARGPVTGVVEHRPALAGRNKRSAPKETSSGRIAPDDPATLSVQPDLQRDRRHVAHRSRCAPEPPARLLENEDETLMSVHKAKG